MKLYKYTEDQLRDAVADSISYRQTLQKLGVAAHGGNYAVIRKAVSEFAIDISHFKGQAWNKGIKSAPRSLEDYLSKKVSIGSHRLRLRLISEGIMKPECSRCGIEEWFDQPAPLELDHIDGNNSNNSLDNLRILCANCHALTPTYRGKNKSKA